MLVLICEDNKDIQDLLDLIVVGTGNEVVKCDSLNKVENILKSQKVNLMIMDYWFKNSDAGDLITELKASKDYSKIPIVIISAIPKLADIAKTLDADAYIKKPFSVDDVRTIIKQFDQKVL